MRPQPLPAMVTRPVSGPTDQHVGLPQSMNPRARQIRTIRRPPSHTSPPANAGVSGRRRKVQRTVGPSRALADTKTEKQRPVWGGQQAAAPRGYGRLEGGGKPARTEHCARATLPSRSLPSVMHPGCQPSSRAIAHSWGPVRDLESFNRDVGPSNSRVQGGVRARGGARGGRRR